MNSLDAEVVDLVEAVADASPSWQFKRSTWSDFASSGLTGIGVAESVGGSGGNLHDVASLVVAAASRAVCLPLAEHLLAGRALERADLQFDAEIVHTIAFFNEAGVATMVPWASVSDIIVCVEPSKTGWTLDVVRPDDLTIRPDTNLAAEPRDNVKLGRSLAGVAIDPAEVSDLRLHAALMRSLQLTSAMSTVLDLVIAHAKTRVQFGRPLTAFQAVQEMLANIAAETRLAGAATEAALDSTAAMSSTREFDIAASRSNTGHSSSSVVRHAHQILGAIGTTEEHPLGRYTTRLLAWRNEFGTTIEWDRRTFELLGSTCAHDAWPLISGVQ